MTAQSKNLMTRAAFRPIAARTRYGQLLRPLPQLSGTYRRTVASTTLLLALLAAGCSPYQLAKRTLYGELAEYPRVTDGRLACQQYQRWAKAEWQQIAASSPETYSADYASGFIQGFVDQVFAGGKAQAPPVPPRKYWRMGYRNEQGRQAIENWFGGFEHGARVAQEGGYRERATIPSSLYADPSAAPAEAWQQHPGGVEPIDMPLQSPTPANAPTPADAPPVDLPSPDELFEQGTASRSGLLPSDLAPPAEFPAELIKQQALANHNESRVSSDPRLTTGTTGGSAAAVLQADYATPTGLLASELPAGDRPSELPPETAGDLPPAPPWHPSTGGVQRASAQVAASTDVSTSSANPEAFDPFGGTPFEAISHGTRGDASAPSSPSTMTPLPASGSSTPMATEPVKPRPARPALPTTSATSAPSSAPLAIPTQSNHVADEIDSAPLLLNAPLQMPMTELPLPPVGQNDAPAPLKLHHLPTGSMPPMASAPTKPLLLPAQLGNASSDRANSIALPQGAAQGAAHDDAISAGGEIVHDTGSSNGGEAAGANELRIENWEMQEQPTSDDANSGWQAKESEPRTQWKGVQ